jgi:dTDP-D-glucose 4,6-dehydratase
LGKRRKIERAIGSLQIDDQAFRQRFGWIPPVSLDNGLRATAEWFNRKESVHHRDIEITEEKQ